MSSLVVNLSLIHQCGHDSTDWWHGSSEICHPWSFLWTPSIGWYCYSPRNCPHYCKKPFLCHSLKPAEFLTDALIEQVNDRVKVDSIELVIPVTQLEHNNPVVSTSKLCPTWHTMVNVNEAIPPLCLWTKKPELLQTKHPEVTASKHSILHRTVGWKPWDCWSLRFLSLSSLMWNNGRIYPPLVYTLTSKTLLKTATEDPGGEPEGVDIVVTHPQSAPLV